MFGHTWWSPLLQGASYYEDGIVFLILVWLDTSPLANSRFVNVKDTPAPTSVLLAPTSSDDPTFLIWGVIWGYSTSFFGIYFPERKLNSNGLSISVPLKQILDLPSSDSYHNSHVCFSHVFDFGENNIVFQSPNIKSAHMEPQFMKRLNRSEHNIRVSFGACLFFRGRDESSKPPKFMACTMV